MNKITFDLALRRFRPSLVLACLGLALAVQAQQPAGTVAVPMGADHIVAVVNSEPITNQDVAARIQRLATQFRQQGQALPPRAEFAKAVLERLILERAQVQAAQSLGIKVE